MYFAPFRAPSLGASFAARVVGARRVVGPTARARRRRSSRRAARASTAREDDGGVETRAPVVIARAGARDEARATMSAARARVRAHTSESCARSARTRETPCARDETSPRTYTSRFAIDARASVARAPRRGRTRTNRLTRAFRRSGQDATGRGVGALFAREFARARDEDVVNGVAATTTTVRGAWRARELEERGGSVITAKLWTASDGDAATNIMLDAIEASGRGTSPLARSTRETSSTSGRARRSGAFGYRPDAGARACVVVECASALERAFGSHAVARLVRETRAHAGVGLVVTMSVVPEGAKEDPCASSCATEASCVARLSAVDGDRSATLADLDVEIRRPCGRRRRERERITVLDDDSLTFAPLEIETVRDAVARALRLEGAAAPEDDALAAAKRLQSVVPFNLGVDLTPQEREAKRNVKLSYEHQGDASAARARDAYASGDFLAYLPPDAGGRGDALGRTKPGRGHIYYERDDVDAEIENEDDLFPDTDDEEEEF